jgi:hypothetical protein
MVGFSGHADPRLGQRGHGITIVTRPRSIHLRFEQGQDFRGAVKPARELGEVVGGGRAISRGVVSKWRHVVKIGPFWPFSQGPLRFGLCAESLD